MPETTESLLELLDSSQQHESQTTQSLRNQATQLISTTTTNPSTLHDLLTSIIKPLFSKSHHPSITSSGRKNLVTQSTLPSTFSNNSIFDPEPPWKTPWTVPLILWTLDRHDDIQSDDISLEQKRKTIEGNFHLLVPAILNFLDDAQIPWKIQGCVCLTSLCSILVNVRSDILRRTGLGEVFFEALRACFHYLPTLTPAEESLELLQAVYPAYLSLVKARFIVLESYLGDTNGLKAEHTNGKDNAKTQTPDEEIIIIRPQQSNTKSQSQSRPQSHQKIPNPLTLTPTQISTETTTKQTHLSTLLRSSLLHTLYHLTTTPDPSTSPAHSKAPSITLYLLSQIAPITREMHGYAATHLRKLIPMLVSILRDPFVGAELGMLDGAVDALGAVVACCWIRVRERWWMECLRGLVAAWLGCFDDLRVCMGRRREDWMGEDGRMKTLRQVMRRMEGLVVVLGDVVGEEFGVVVGKLVDEEPELVGLFEGVKM